MAAVDSSSVSKETAPAATKWLLTNKQPISVTQDAVKLFCVPQAGMGAWVFQAWAEKLAPNIQVCCQHELVALSSVFLTKNCS